MNAVVSILSRSKSSDQLDLSAAASRWLELKAIEANAIAERRALEDAMAPLVDNGKEAGTSNAEAGDYKVKVERKLDYKVDMAGLSRVIDKLPEAVRDRLIRTKVEVDVKELKFLRNNEPEIYQIASNAVTVKPARPSFSVSAE